MSHLTRCIPRPMPPLLNGLLPSSAAVCLDIETTGLSPLRHQVTLVGLLFLAFRGRVIEQFFADDPVDERDLLAVLTTLTHTIPKIMTFNGRRFDLPFLAARCSRYGIKWPEISHLDLMSVAQQWNARHHVLPNCKLQTLMKHFRLARTDTSRGSDMVVAYRRWLRIRDPAEREHILNHNAEDILLMPELGEQLYSDVE